MKKIMLLASVAILMSSCYNTKVFVGDVNLEDPTVKVNSVMNHHLLYGLIPVSKTELKADKYVGHRKNYVVKNNMSFVDGLLSVITFGIYTPMTTTFYVPLDEQAK